MNKEELKHLILKNELFQEIEKLKAQLYSKDQIKATCPNCGEEFLINQCRVVSDLQEQIRNLEILVEDIKLDVPLNEEQERLLDKILFRKGKKMNKEKTKYWVWKNTIIDFDNLTDEHIECNDYVKKVDYIFYYLGTPNKEIHEWYNGGWSSEYNEALRYAIQIGLVEWYKDTDEELENLQDRINKAIEFINKHKWNGSYEDDYDIYLCEGEINKLISILKGEENEK